MLSAGKEAEELELSYTAGWNGKWYDHFGKKFGDFLKGTATIRSNHSTEDV